jgi:uncharacterized protein (DUF1499 family)
MDYAQAHLLWIKGRAMTRMRLAEEPLSGLAVWSRRLAGFSIPVLLLSIIIIRSGLLEITPALATFGGALVLAFGAIVLAVGAFVVIWKEGCKGLGHAVTAMLIGIAILAYPTFLAVRASRLPMMTDITTDPADPPRFDTIARLRPRNANPIAYPGSAAAELQRTGYPDIEPLQVSASPQQTYEAALAMITKHKWRVVDLRPPQTTGRREGVIEAVARTPIMGFRDDVAVRIRFDEEGSRVDIRSASRYGRTDFGTNAARIRRMLSDIDDSAGSEGEAAKKPAKPAKPEQAPAKPQARARR